MKAVSVDLSNRAATADKDVWKRTIMATSVEWIYEAFDQELRRFVLGRVGDPETAADILQDTYLRIHARIDTLREADRVRSWVYQIARNAIIDHYRRRREAVELPEDLALPEEPGQDLAEQVGASLKQMIDCLPDKDREALVLTEIQSLTQQQLAERVGLSLSGAKSRVQRARERLKAALLDCCHVEFDRAGQVVRYEPRCPQCAQPDYRPGCASSRPSTSGEDGHYGSARLSERDADKL
jgi:RNA polymerase sigma-70 factor (ECF subfamily)